MKALPLVIAEIWHPLTTQYFNVPARSKASTAIGDLCSVHLHCQTYIKVETDMLFHLQRTISARLQLLFTRVSHPFRSGPLIRILQAPAERNGHRVLPGISRRLNPKRHLHVHVANSASTTMPTDHSSQANYEDIRTKHIDFGKRRRRRSLALSIT